MDIRASNAPSDAPSHKTKFRASINDAILFLGPLSEKFFEQIVAAGYVLWLL
jgi:hypothetical protein